VGYSSTHSLTSALDGGEWSASRPGHFTPRERALGTDWIGGSVGPRTGLDAVSKIRIPRWPTKWLYSLGMGYFISKTETEPQLECNVFVIRFMCSIIFVLPYLDSSPTAALSVGDLRLSANYSWYHIANILPHLETLHFTPKYSFRFYFFKYRIVRVEYHYISVKRAYQVSHYNYPQFHYIPTTKHGRFPII
jgi:hypothetical protein